MKSDANRGIIDGCAAEACNDSNAGFVDAYCISVYTYQTLHADICVSRWGSAATFWVVRSKSAQGHLLLRCSHVVKIPYNAALIGIPMGWEVIAVLELMSSSDTLKRGKWK